MSQALRDPSFDPRPTLAVFDSALKDVPDYQAFLSPAELNARGAELRDRFPGLVSRDEVGRSEEGRPIVSLSIGQGTKTALLVGFPHPDEPIGGLAADYLAERLALDADLRAGLDITWHILTCADPDGATLNEGWFRGPWNPLGVALGHYRPAGDRQIERTFPIHYKTLNLETPLAETRALMTLIDQAKPDFVCSFHNSPFGGVAFYVSDDQPGLYPELWGLARSLDLPLAPGEPGLPYAPRLAEAVYRLPGARETYDYFARFARRDPAEAMGSAASGQDYAKATNPGVFTMVADVPLFLDRRACDTSPAGVSRRAAVLAETDLAEETSGAIRREYEKAARAGLLRLAFSPFRAALDVLLETEAAERPCLRDWATSTAHMARPATVDEAFRRAEGAEFTALTTLGLARRMFLGEAAAAGKDGLYPSAEAAARASAALRLSAERLARAMKERASRLEAGLEYAVPVRQLVRLQVGAALLGAWRVSRG